MSGQTLLLIFGITLVTGLGIFFLVKFINKKNRSKNLPTKNEKEEFLEIETFDENQYVEDTFQRIFHSVKMDNWEKEIHYDEITFEKGPEGANEWDKVKLLVKYKISKGKFIIDNIHLSAGTFFTFKGEVEIDDYRFFYDCYAKWKQKENRDTKDRADASLSKIHSVIGKASIRDSKLDELLGEEN